MTSAVIVETSLLKTLSNKDNYNQYINYVDVNRLLPNTKVLLKDYRKYFDLFPEDREISHEKFLIQFTQNWHVKDLDQQDIDYYKEFVFPAIQKYDNSNIEHCVLGLINKQTSEKLSDFLTKDFNDDDLKKVLNDHEEKKSTIIRSSDSDAFTITTIDMSPLIKSGGIPYCVPSLQEGLGSIVKGQFIVVSADYGTGKSAFVIHQAVHTFQHLIDTQDNRPILYFNSEGTEGDVFGRFLSNLYRTEYSSGFEEIVNNWEQVRDKFKEGLPIDKFLVFQIYGHSINYIKQKIKKYSPALVIIDITDVLAPEEDVINLKKTYDHLRLLSGEYCPIIGTTQSGDTTYFDKETNAVKQRRWLGDHALYGSKSGKGGAADTIITIGKEEGTSNIRYITTPKKKRGEVVHVTCELQDKYSLYKEITF